MIMKTSRTNLRDRCRHAIAGIQKHLSNEPSVPLDGRALTPAQLEAQLQSAVQGADATVAAHATFSEAVKAEKAQRASTVALLAALSSFVVLKFGKDAVAVQADFGFSPRKKSQRSVDAKSLAAAKARATREARGTRGAKQKRPIKGNVESHTITAPGAVAPAAATGDATPAAGAASNNPATGPSSGASTGGLVAAGTGPGPVNPHPVASETPPVTVPRQS
jgi:hypothetical protein